MPWERGDLEMHSQAGTPVIVLETSHSAQFQEEIRSQGIVIPGMDDFDETIRGMGNANPQE